MRNKIIFLINKFLEGRENKKIEENKKKEIEYKKNIVVNLNFHKNEFERLSDDLRSLNYAYRTSDYQFLDRMEEARQRYLKRFYSLQSKIKHHAESYNSIVDEIEAKNGCIKYDQFGGVLIKWN